MKWSEWQLVWFLFQIQSWDQLQADTLQVFDIVFWKGIANPQSGVVNDCNDQINDL